MHSCTLNKVQATAQDRYDFQAGNTNASQKEILSTDAGSKVQKRYLEFEDGGVHARVVPVAQLLSVDHGHHQISACCQLHDGVK